MDERRAKQHADSYNAALICSVLCNINRDPKKKSDPFTPDDFLPRYENPKPAKPPSPADVATKAATVMKRLQKLNQ